MITSVITSATELKTFLIEATRTLGDPSSTVCQVFVKWEGSFASDEITASWLAPDETLLLEFPDVGGVGILPLQVSTRGPVMENGALRCFHIRQISTNIWALAPSLNVPGAIHAFIVIHGVPSPAPWEQLIILA